MTGSRKPINANYSLHGHVLETDTCARYLGVDVSRGLSGRFHIDRITGSATKRLCVKAVTEPDSAESTEITDRALAESTKYNGKLRFSDTGI